MLDRVLRLPSLSMASSIKCSNNIRRVGPTAVPTISDNTKKIASANRIHATYHRFNRLQCRLRLYWRNPLKFSIVAPSRKNTVILQHPNRISRIPSCSVKWGSSPNTSLISRSTWIHSHNRSVYFLINQRMESTQINHKFRKGMRASIKDRPKSLYKRGWWSLSLIRIRRLKQRKPQNEATITRSTGSCRISYSTLRIRLFPSNPTLTTTIRPSSIRTQAASLGRI
jgi:hypothetical protein